jgi:hypothetical protein
VLRYHLTLVFVTQIVTYNNSTEKEIQLEGYSDGQKDITMSYYQCNCRNNLSGLSEKEREDFQCGCGLNLSSSDLCNDSVKGLCPGPPMLDRQNNGIEGL